MERLYRTEQFTEQITGQEQISCEVVQMGKDYTICVWGGDTPHIGSTVMSVARPSLNSADVSVTSSVINGIGHKDEYVARKFAEAVAKKKNCTAVCTCGIHIDNITKEQLLAVEKAGERMLEKILERLKETL